MLLNGTGHAQRKHQAARHQIRYCWPMVRRYRGVLQAPETAVDEINSADPRTLGRLDFETSDLYSRAI